MTNPKGLHIAANYDRVVAPPQRLPCQKTKPKGLWCRGGLWWFDLSAYTNGYMRMILNDQP